MCDPAETISSSVNPCSFIFSLLPAILGLQSSNVTAFYFACSLKLRIYHIYIYIFSCCCRYVPGEQALLQIDSFCVTLIVECDSVTSRRVSPWLKSLDQQSAASVTSGSAIPPSLPTSSFASGALVKSLNYVRSLVARHLPRRPLYPAAFAGSSSASRQALPTLSSLLSRSFNYQLSPAPISSRESPERQEVSNASDLNLTSPERIDGEEGSKYIAIDVLKWRWTVDREQQTSSVPMERCPLSTFLCSLLVVC